MNKITAALPATAALAVLSVLPACSSQSPHAACLAAIRRIAHEAQAQPSHPAYPKPAVCKALPAREYNSIGRQVIREVARHLFRHYLTASPAPVTSTAAPSPSRSPLVVRKLACQVEVLTVVTTFAQKALNDPAAKFRARRSDIPDCFTIPRRVYRKLLRDAFAELHLTG